LRDIRRWLDLNHFGAAAIASAAIAPAAALPSSRDGHTAERYAELVRLPADAIVAWGTPASLAAKRATGTVPIVMVSGDPIAVGLVPGLAHPGANVTGLSTLPWQLLRLILHARLIF
jgi:hypothetical protein